MKYENMSFKAEDEDGNLITYDILSVVPNEEDEESPYVIFTDYMLEDDDDFIMQYGKIIKQGDDFAVQPIFDKLLIDRIKVESQDVVTNYVNNQVQSNIE